MKAEKLIDLIASSKGDFEVRSMRSLVPEIKQALLVRKGELIDERLADERAKNIAAIFYNTLVTG